MSIQVLDVTGPPAPVMSCELSGLGHCARKHPVGYPNGPDRFLWGVAWITDDGCMHPFQYVLTQDEAVEHLGRELANWCARRPVVLVRRESASDPWEATL
ncbi:hypothetical protein JWS13_39015 [Rhodococcus pseudokoreensis]|uniref:Uncharacterized protein n=1 Tax=Rhodococcus pseudokoreensis TaxID=2811421 RepID=A0A974WAI9_9NOCA|nr:hypothetical protein [Rhodococcus pseudokoreensis]QSE94170.1 hypothetical protein JWS13_39015 [Rhodococcus pseudokoreensis]